MIKNLIYHIYPRRDFTWNLEQLEKYMHLFNGCKIAVVAVGDGSLPWTKEVSKLGFDTILTEKNDVALRETATLLPLLKELYGTKGVTFYGHTKGVTHSKKINIKRANAIRNWAWACYFHNLNRIAEVESLLARYPVVGTFKRLGKFDSFPPESKWHYSGTFYWFRNKDLFSRDWTNVPPMRYGAEAYPSMLFDDCEAGCIFGENPGNLYDPANNAAVLNRYGYEKV